MLNEKHVAKQFSYKLYNIPYRVNVAIFVHLVNVCYHSFIEQKFLIILQQSGILCTEPVTCKILVICPKTSIFLPPVNDNKKLKCVCVYVCVCVICLLFYFIFIFLFVEENTDIKIPAFNIKNLNFIFTNPPLNHCCICHS
jgi:hypothetical protein